MSKLSEIEVLVKQAAVQALKDFRADEKKREKKAILHNTELMLRNYLELKDFFENCAESDYIADEEIVVGSLRRDKAVSRILYHHINTRIKDIRRKEPKKLVVLDILYLDPLYQNTDWKDKLIELEEKHGIIERTAYRWKNELIENLGVKLFGADGLRIWTIS